MRPTRSPGWVNSPGEIDGHPGAGAAALLGWSEDADSRDTDEAADVPTWSLADAVPVGSMAAVALIEHLWAVPLRAAIQRVGGRPLEETWLTASDVKKLETLIAERDG